MIARELKEKLRRRETQVGTFVKLADPTAMEVLGLAGMDFAIVDTEHAPCDQMLLLDLLRAADSVKAMKSASFARYSAGYQKKYTL